MKNVLVIDPADFMGGAELCMLDFLSRANHKKAHYTVLTGGLPEYMERIKSLDKKITQVAHAMPRLKPIGPRSALRALSAVKNLAQSIRERSPDIIVTNSIRAHIIGTYAARKTGKPIIWMIHDFTFPNFFIKKLAQTPEKIIVPSQAVAEYTKKQIPEELHEKIIIIPNGIDLEKVDATPLDDNLRPKKIAPGTPLIGIIGRIDRWKGQDKVISALTRILEKIPDAHLLIIGEPSAHDPKTLEFDRAIRKKVEEIGLVENVTFTGFVKNVYGAIKGLSCLVHASTEPEPFGRVVIEAMACGVPVVAGNLGGPGEVVRSGQTGLLVNPNNPGEIAQAVIQILTDPNLAKNLSGRARLAVEERYALPKIVARIEKEILGNFTKTAGYGTVTGV